MMENEAFDRMLAGALRARPEAVAGIDVAGEALARVRAQEEALARLARVSWWGRMSSVAAVVLIAVTAGIGYWVWPASTSTSSTTDATTSAVSTVSSVDWTTVGVGAFVVALVVMVLMTVLTPERPTGAVG